MTHAVKTANTYYNIPDESPEDGMIAEFIDELTMGKEKEKAVSLF